MIYFLHCKKVLIFAIIFILAPSSFHIVFSSEILAQTPKVISFFPTFNRIVITINPTTYQVFSAKNDSGRASDFDYIKFIQLILLK